jgi:hypothetical protein
MSALPKAVQAQIDRANQLSKEVYGKDPTPPEPDPHAPVAAAPAPAETPVEQPVAAAPAPAETPAPSPEPTPAPPANVTPAPAPDFEQRYKVLQGKYNAEVPRLQAQTNQLIDQVRQLTSQLTSTQALLASLGTQQPAAPAQPAPAPQGQRLVKDEEVQEFGADLIDVVRRVAREENGSVLSEVDRRLQPVAKQLAQTSNDAKAAKEEMQRNTAGRFFDELSEAVPNWQQQNTDQGFLQWLDQRDPYTGRVRGDLLTEAYQAHEASRVVAFFLGYQNEHAAVTPPPAPASAPAPAAGKTLEGFIAPGTAKPGPAGAQEGSGKRVWTRGEIGQFYSAVRTGQIKAGSTEAKRLEADIFAAQREGRVR